MLGQRDGVGLQSRAASLARCIVVCVLKEAAAPESEEFEVSAKSAVPRRLVSAPLSALYSDCKVTYSPNSPLIPLSAASARC